jgi:hypothetical protein
MVPSAPSPHELPSGASIAISPLTPLDAEPLSEPRSTLATRWLTVSVGPPGPAARGRLALFLEGAIERALDARQAPPPGVGASSDLQASLDDQLTRARLVGLEGVWLHLSTLRGITGPEGAFDTEDSAVVRWLLVAARRRPLKLLFHPDDRDIGVFGAPAPLESLLADEDAASFPPPAPAPEVRAGALAMQGVSACLSEATAADDELEDVSVASTLEASARFTEALREELDRSAKTLERELEESARTLADDVAETAWLHETLIHLSTPPPAASAPPHPTGELVDLEGLAPQAPRWELAPPAMEDLLATLEEDNGAADDEDPGALLVDAHAGADDPGELLDTHADAVDPGELRVDTVTPAVEPVDPELAARAAAWERELKASQGPKPLSLVERQFTTAYMPLRDAMLRGAAPEGARDVLETWSRSFEKSYTEAFEVLRYRGKRPVMVLDLPDLASRLGRLHGARSTQLILVDGLRFDVGLMVDERLRSLVGGRAACAERLLLWSALPTNTATQVELLGRGPIGLRELLGVGDEDALVAKGRKAATLRRLRTGRRELLKLDIVEARLSEPGGPEPERVADIADEVAERLAAHFEGVADRTLVVVFGDHGFHLDARDGGTTAARHGGASPEEVLVPAFAWIVGSLH